MMSPRKMYGTLIVMLESKQLQHKLFGLKLVYLIN